MKPSVPQLVYIIMKFCKISNSETSPGSPSDIEKEGAGLLTLFLITGF
jgi:hypothetical protein